MPASYDSKDVRYRAASAPKQYCFDHTHVAPPRLQNKLYYFYA